MTIDEKLTNITEAQTDTFHGLLRSLSVNYGDDHTAYICGEARVSCRELLERSDSLAVSLIRNYRIRPGDRVSIIGSNSGEWLAVLFAVIRAGAAAVVENPALRGKEIKNHYRDFDVRLILTGKISDRLETELRNSFGNKVCGFGEIASAALTAEDEKMLDDIENSLPPRRDALSYFTSGSTSKPKVVMLSQEAVISDAKKWAQRLELHDDYYLVSTPLAHIMGFVLMMRYLILGGTCILTDNKTEQIADAFRKYNISEFLNVPTIIKKLAGHEEFASLIRPRVRYIITGTMPVSFEERLWIEEKYEAVLVIGYGMTEASCAITMPAYDTDAEKRYKSVGNPLDAVDVRIRSLSADGASDPFCPAGKTGEVLVRGETLMNGYAQNNDSDEVIDERGYLHTGDIGYLDADGFLYIRGRKKNIIIKGGENILPGEIEECISGLENVKSVAVVGVTDEVYGENIAALVIPDEGCDVTLEDVREIVGRNYTSFKMPEYLFLYDEFPMTMLGKPDINKLKIELDSKIRERKLK